MSTLKIVQILEDAMSPPMDIPRIVELLRSLSEALGIADSRAEEIVRELLYDLDFYEPDPVARREDPSFLDESQAVAEVRQALVKLHQITDSAET